MEDDLRLRLAHQGMHDECCLLLAAVMYVEQSEDLYILGKHYKKC